MIRLVNCFYRHFVTVLPLFVYGINFPKWRNTQKSLCWKLFQKLKKLLLEKKKVVAEVETIMDDPTSCLPDHVMEDIFFNLDPETLFNANMVNRRWSDILCNMNQRKYWKMIVENNIEICQSIRKKGNLNDKEVYKNSRLWQKCNQARVDLYSRLIPVEEPIHDIFVNSEGKLCLTTSEAGLVVDLSTMTVILRVPGSYLRFVHDMGCTAKLSKTNFLTIEYTSDASRHFAMIRHVTCFRIIPDGCIYVKITRQVCKYTFSTNSHTEMGDMLDNTTQIDLHNGTIFLLAFFGGNYQYVGNRFIYLKSFYINFREYAPARVFTLFGDNVIQSDMSNVIIQLKEWDHKIYPFANVSALMVHGPMLILGTLHGKIFLFKFSKYQELLNLDMTAPFMTLSLEKSEAIFNFDIAEEAGCHRLFALLTESVALFQLTYENV